jgi:hypothetical protein
MHLHSHRRGGSPGNDGTMTRPGIVISALHVMLAASSGKAQRAPPVGRGSMETFPRFGRNWSVLNSCWVTGLRGRARTGNTLLAPIVGLRKTDEHPQKLGQLTRQTVSVTLGVGGKSPWVIHRWRVWRTALLSRRNSALLWCRGARPRSAWHQGPTVKRFHHGERRRPRRSWLGLSVRTSIHHICTNRRVTCLKFLDLR